MRGRRYLWGAAAACTAPRGEVTPGPGGKVIVIEATTDEKGNFFTPNEIEAPQGRCASVHAQDRSSQRQFSSGFRIPVKPVSRLRASMLQLPGQTLDIPVNFAAGKYYFQCDPHAALGMKGHLEVEDESH